ncbi:MAG: nicotinamide riboside transporter PnuC [Bacteroidetes bacterium]|nr:MAG: nicotinamide riboside transporter PnuC [Bacteroidota bacterium]
MLEYIRQNPYEFWGFVTSLICVWLNARENVWGWGWAIVSSILSAKLFYDQRLFGDMYLQFFFAISALYGIYSWLYGGKDKSELWIQKMPFNTTLYLLFLGIIGWALLVRLLLHIKGDAVYLDALVTTLSILGQYMMARKYIEHWFVWIVANVLYVGLFAYKALWLYTFLYAIFIVLAVYGYWNWRILYRKSE